MDKTRIDYDACCRVLDANIALFHQGVKDTYRVVATELRKLLCDKKALLPRVFQEVKFHKLHLTGLLEKDPSLADHLLVYVPGRLSADNTGKSRFVLTFDSARQQMELGPWLDQPLFAPNLSVRDLIMSVANKEGAHSDPDYNESLLRAKMVEYVKEESHQPCIIAIAEYVLAFVRTEPLLFRDEGV